LQQVFKQINRVSDNPENCEIHNAAKLLSYMLVNFEASLTLEVYQFQIAELQQKALTYNRSSNSEWEDERITNRPDKNSFSTKC
jgi:hypothetical protein